MRRLSHFLGLLSVVGFSFSAEAQKVYPAFRPAVLGSGPTSLVNLVDTKELLAKGQKDGGVMFCAAVAKTGEVTFAWTYRAMPGSEALEEEIMKRLQETKVAPAIYNHQPVAVLLYGTAVFSAAQTPHLRIFLNQDPKELMETTDFIGPQPVQGADSKFDGLTPPESGSSVALTAIVDLRIKVSIDGQLKEMKVVREEAPGLGYAIAAMNDFREAKFIPAFRDGDAIESDVIVPVCYKATD